MFESKGGFVENKGGHIVFLLFKIFILNQKYHKIKKIVTGDKKCNFAILLIYIRLGVVIK